MRTRQSPQFSDRHFLRSPFLAISIFLVAAAFYCYEFVLRILPGALQTELAAAFGHVSATTFGELSALYYFAYSPMQLPVGVLLDRYGSKRVLTLACLSCAIGSLFYSMTFSLWLVAIGRLMVGFGSAFAFVGALALAFQWLPQRYFSVAAGCMTSLGMFGLMYGEMKMTQLAANMNVVYILWAMAGIGFFMTVLIFSIVRDAKKRTTTMTEDFRTFFSRVWHVLILPEVWLVGIVAATLYTSLSVFGELWGKTYLEQAHHMTKPEAAKAVSFLFLGWAVGSPLSGYFSDVTKKRLTVLAWGGLGALVCIAVVLYVPHLSFKAVSTLIFMYGVFSGAEITAFVTAKEYCDENVSSTAFASINMIVSLVGFIFQPLVGLLLDTAGHGQLIAGERVYPVFSYQVGLSVLPVSLIVMMLCLYGLHRRRQ